MDEIPENQAGLDWLILEYLTVPEPEAAHVNGAGTPRRPAAQLSDDEIIALCRGAKNAAKFSDLFDHGDVNRHHGGDDSRADQALASIFAFYTDDAAQIERLMSRSALGQRPKWRRRQDYRRRTVAYALRDPRRERYKAPVTVTVTPKSDSDGDAAENDTQKVGGTTRLRSVSFAEIEEPGPGEMIVKGLIPKGWPSTIFGGTGVAKTIKGLSLGQAIADPGVSRWLAWDVATTNVLYLDLELNTEEQTRRAYRIARGSGLAAPPSGLRYMTTFGVPRRERPEVMKNALEECRAHNAGVLFIDSLGLALRGDLADAENVIDWFEDDLAAFLGEGITVVMIDHQRRRQPGERNQALGVFGSVYKENLSRTMIQIEFVRRDREEHSIITRIRAKKSNFDELRGSVNRRVAYVSSNDEEAVESL
jgi:hypothetical protein